MIPRNPRRLQAPLRPQAGRPLRRRSERYPGLVLEFDSPFLTFKQGRAFEVFKLKDGHPELMACSPKGYGELELFEHTRAVAIAYAEALAADQRRITARLATRRYEGTHFPVAR